MPKSFAAVVVPPNFLPPPGRSWWVLGIVIQHTCHLPEEDRSYTDESKCGACFFVEMQEATRRNGNGDDD